MTQRRWFNLGAHVALVPCALVGCTGGGGATSGGSGAASSSGATNACVYKEKGTDFSDCKEDGDCFSGYCHQTCKPGPCCQNPNTTAMKAGRGYSCKTDADCAAVGTEIVARGARASCRYDNLNSISNGCSFLCDGTLKGSTSSTSGSTGSSSGSSTSSSGSGTSSGSSSGSGTSSASSSGSGP